MRNGKGICGLSRNCSLNFPGALVGLIFALLASTGGCAPEVAGNAIGKANLQSALRTKGVVPVTDFVNVPSGTICVLYPYQIMVDQTAPRSEQINAHLKEQNYSSDEDQWAFVVASNGSTVVSVFRRASDFDIFSLAEIHALDYAKLPAGFVPANCAEIGRARISSIDLRNRTFLLLGEVK